MMERTDDSLLYSAEEDIESCLKDISSLQNLRLWSEENGLSKHPLVVERRDELHLLNALDFDEIPTKPKDSHRCHICDKTFVQKRNLSRHFREKHADSGHSCGKCGKKFTAIRYLKQHLKICIGLEKNTCPCEKCGKTFTAIRNLKQHSKICMVLELPKYVCSICKKLCSTKRGLQQHAVVHSNPTTPETKQNRKRLASDLVESTITSKRAIQNPSVKGQPGPEAARIHCRTCGEEFADRRTLYLHRMSTHIQRGEWLQLTPFGRDVPWQHDKKLKPCTKRMLLSSWKIIEKARSNPSIMFPWPMIFDLTDE